MNPAEDDASSNEDEDELDDEAVYNLSVSEDSDDDDTDDFEDDEEDEDDKSRYAQRGSCYSSSQCTLQAPASSIMLRDVFTWWHFPQILLTSMLTLQVLCSEKGGEKASCQAPTAAR